mmetsp:Transcript_33024/g.104508  ORF Transcript_33024/g.104508 Transcript_33024/m.104508 type:complete len:382 (-) Transcript_33024:22-1167(-)
MRNRVRDEGPPKPKPDEAIDPELYVVDEEAASKERLLGGGPAAGGDAEPTFNGLIGAALLLLWRRYVALVVSSRLFRCLACLAGGAAVALLYVAYINRDVPHQYVTPELLRAQLGGRKFTVRINTYRRMDFLTASINNLVKCPDIEEIQVVWSDVENDPPLELIEGRAADGHDVKLVVEVHETNTINNRFMPTIPIPTDAVLSIDDDLLPTCEQLRAGFQVWLENPETMVGYHPRHIAGNAYNQFDQLAYLNGYHMVLTKISFQHKKYFKAFETERLRPVREYIDERLNCEDIAMAFVVSEESGLPGLWVDVGYKPKEMWMWYHIHRGIHSKLTGGKKDHTAIRSGCVEFFRSVFKEGTLTKKTYVKYSSAEMKYYDRYGL